MTSKKNTPEQDAAEAMGLPKVSQSELDKAKKEGALEAAKENAKDSFQYATDGNLPSPVSGPQYPGSDDIMRWEPMLGLGVDEFKKRITDDSAETAVPEEKVAGLLKLERAGQNRTEYVKTLMDRLGVKSPYEVTDAGPDYTNDATPVSKL
ncbi:hypothetical protein [Novosphingobium sp. M1R2S20]|uniref:Uncharacterized protein n=1 Tax=Novosphingobium rhizovicinum TaxID=3228928 RepID=A0ABV3RFA5_9SPHN